MASQPRTTPLRDAAVDVLSSPQLANAAAITAVGIATLAGILHRIVGWPAVIAALACLVLLGASSLLVRRRELGWQGIFPVSLVVFLGWAMLSISWSQYQWSTLGGLAYLLTFTFLGATIALTRDTIQIVRIYGDSLRVFLVASLALEIFSGLLIDMPITFLGIRGNLAELGPIEGLAGTRNQLGLIALLALVTFATETRTKSVNRPRGWASIGLAAVAILLSRSPVTLLCLAVVMAAAAALFVLRRIRPELRTYAQLALLVATAIGAVFAWTLRSPIVSVLQANSELEYRVALWRRIWNLIALHPLEGWGWIGRWDPGLQPFPAFSSTSTSAANGYLDIWFQLGLVGLVIFVGAALLAFTRSWLLAGRKRSFVYAWPALVLVVLLSSALAESSILIELGWLTLVVCSVKAAQELSWRTALRSTGPLPPTPGPVVEGPPGNQ